MSGTRFFSVTCFWFIFNITAELKFLEPEITAERKINQRLKQIFVLHSYLYREKLCFCLQGRNGDKDDYLLYCSTLPFLSVIQSLMWVQVRYLQWILHFSQSVSRCFMMLRLGDSLSPFPDCNSITLLLHASTYLIPLWDGSKSKLTLQ